MRNGRVLNGVRVKQCEFRKKNKDQSGRRKCPHRNKTGSTEISISGKENEGHLSTSENRANSL
jgi:hypothetical protein